MLKGILRPWNIDKVRRTTSNHTSGLHSQDLAYLTFETMKETETGTYSISLRSLCVVNQGQPYSPIEAHGNIM